MYQQIRKSLGTSVAAIATIAACLFSQSAMSQGLNYVDASHLVDPFNLPDFGAIGGGTGNDNLWGPRQDFGSGAMPSALDGIGVFESANGTADDAPEMRFVFTGSQVLPAGSYDVYSVFWTDDDENWTLSTGTTSGSLTSYSFSGNGGPFPITAVNTTKGITAAAAVWDTLPPVTPAGTTLYDRPGADPLIMLLAKAGTVVADGVSDVTVYIDDLPNQGGGRRSWFDGVAYVAAGTPIALTTTINRDTGELIITNPTDQDFFIKSIDISSPGGALIGAGWDPITGRLDNGNGFDADPWFIGAPADPVNTPFALQLLESEEALPSTPGGTLAAGGGSLNLGALWRRTPLEDVIVRLTLSNDTPVTISPIYSGGSVVLGDFNNSGVLEIGDFQILLDNLQTNVTAITAIERYARGNLNNDFEINWGDFQAFRGLWDAEFGDGSFEAMVGGTQVPEPSSLALLAMGALAFGFAIRRKFGLLTVLLICGAMGGISRTAQAIDIKVDLDSTRTSGTVIGTPFTTQTGFTSWDITELETAGNIMVVDGVTLELFGFSAVDLSRIRATGGGGPFNDLLADFAFHEGANGRAIGLRLTDLPVGIYHMESWHYDGVNAVDSTRINIRDQGGANLKTVVANSLWSQNSVPYILEVTAATPPREVVFVENSTANRSRLNGFTIADFAGLTLEVTRNTGAMRILNEQGSPLDLSYYEIQSVSGQLDFNNWTTFDSGENDDAVGVGWDVITNPTANVISEVNLVSMSTVSQSGMSGDSLSLGNAFTANGTEDIRFLYAAPGDFNLRAGYVKYITDITELTGDYNDDGVVDAADYVVWRDNLNSSTDLNGDLIGGTIGTGQYNQWRQNFGATPGSGSGTATAIPEPVSLGLLAVAALGLVVGTRRSRKG